MPLLELRSKLHVVPMNGLSLELLLRVQRAVLVMLLRILPKEQAFLHKRHVFVQLVTAEP